MLTSQKRFIRKKKRKNLKKKARNLKQFVQKIKTFLIFRFLIGQPGSSSIITNVEDCVPSSTCFRNIVWLENDLICFCQQVHIYNQEARMCFRRSQHPVSQDLNPITCSEFEAYCHSLPSSVMKMKLPLRLENVGFEDTSYMAGPSRFYYRPTIADELLDVAEDWNAALRRIVHTREVEAMQTTIEESDKENEETEVKEVEISDIKDEVSSNANESVVLHESEQPIIDVSNNEPPTKSGSDLICDKESIMEKYELISGESVEL